MRKEKFFVVFFVFAVTTAFAGECHIKTNDSESFQTRNYRDCFTKAERTLGGHENVRQCVFTSGGRRRCQNVRLQVRRVEVEYSGHKAQIEGVIDL